jgi:hypothetical protein
MVPESDLIVAFPVVWALPNIPLKMSRKVKLNRITFFMVDKLFG